MAEVILSEHAPQDKQTVVTVTFYGTEIMTIKVGDEVFVAMRPVVEGLGLSWPRQSQKLQGNKEKFKCCHMATVAEDGKNREILVIPLRKLNGWLFSVNPMKVKREIREKLIHYQEECFAALYSYWHNGVAVNPNAIPDAPTGPTMTGSLTTSQQQELKELVQAKASAYPDAVKRKVFSQIWIRLQRKFKVPRYEELPVAVFGEARDYVIAMQVRSVEAPKLPQGDTAKSLSATSAPITIRDYASVFAPLPSLGYWSELSRRLVQAHNRFQEEFEAIKKDALKPFREGRRIEVATFLDFATIEPYKRMLEIADDGQHIAYRGAYSAIVALEGLHDMLLRG